jgi:hypothetical protein
VITKVVHGWRPGGLIAYLLGPGVAEVHRDPRVIASWDGLDAGHQPARSGPGEYDLNLGPLIDALHAPAVAAGLPLRAPDGAGRGYVWHCSVRLAETDRVLSDTEWAGIARELLHDAGIAVTGDAGGPRWVAVRHAEDHIHIAAVLVRRDTLRRFWPRHDYPKLRASARRIEARLGLTATGPAEGTAAKAPVRGELAKARREFRPPAREVLRRAVRRAAVRASGVAEFVAALEAVGLQVQMRRAPSGDPIGYAVAQPADLLAPGEPVFYSGSKLAPDLSLPKLIRRWDQQRTSVPSARGTAGNARRVVDRARVGLTGPDATAVGEDISLGAADLLTAISAVAPVQDRARWQAAVDHAYRVPGPDRAQSSVLGGQLRGLARRLMHTRGFASRDETAAAALVVALTRLFLELAAYQRDRGRAHAADAAQRTAGLVTRMPPPVAARVVPPRAAQPRHGRERTPTLLP